MSFEYWEECIGEAFDDAKINATTEQIKIVAEWVEGGHDNYSMATGSDHIPNPQTEEIKKIQAELNRERNKTICRKCNGTGECVSHGPCHSAYSSCIYCRGTGFLY